MGWGNPPRDWKTHQALLSGLAVPAEEAPRSRRKVVHEVEVRRPEGPVTPYAELHCHSHFSFLDGASSPEALVVEAIRLGLDALAITDHDGFYGAPLFAEVARVHARHGLRTVYGAELSLALSRPQNGVPDPEGRHLLVLARGVEGYHRLAGAITEAQLRGDEKGHPVYDVDELVDRGRGHWLVLTGCRKGYRTHEEIERLVDRFGADGVAVELTDRGLPTDQRDNDRLRDIAGELGLPAVATGNVHYATRGEHRLAAAMAAIRTRRGVAELEGWLPPPTACLRSGEEMAARFARYPGAVARSVEIAGACAFDLQKARPELPMWSIPPGKTPMGHLRELTRRGFAERYGDKPADLQERARQRIATELAVIEKKGFAGYFVIVHDIVAFAREEHILCQGRGSAAASAVCYALGITAVDPVFYKLPFERFISVERTEEPDIDVDFDARKRERVIQWVYDVYGRRNAAQVANVISYRPRMAIRDAAKALGYSTGQQDAWSKQVRSWHSVEVGQDAGIPEPVLALAAQLLGAPRHLGIHSGGMILTDRPIGEVVPIERARMEKRTVLQWDKDACEFMGLVKFDLLGLGMLSALDHMMSLAAEHLGESWTLADVPNEEPAVYDMLCRADSVGVFQVESRAQIGTLPRLRPRCFYDLVIEIALIRPGPIQGGAVHPYIDRKLGKPFTCAVPELADDEVLGRTLGVPLFQEQIIAMGRVLGGLEDGDADLLRRAMGSKRGIERIEAIRQKLFAGMAGHGITGQQAEGIYQQMLAFANFGFAESHALSFARLVYASSWFKLHYPAIFLAALLRAQPMGFYSPASLVGDARRHGVRVLRPDLRRSGATAGLEADPGAPATAAGLEDCLTDWRGGTTEFCDDTPDPTPQHRRDTAYAVRLGFDAVDGIGSEVATRIVAARTERPFRDIPDLSRRAGLETRHLEMLAAAGALSEAFGLTRRQALWEAAWAESEEQLEGLRLGAAPALPEMSEIKTMLTDLWSTGITTDDHPYAYLRDHLRTFGIPTIAELSRVRPGTVLTVAGLVTHRQRPGTAGGVTFFNLEDESGMLNVVVPNDVWSKDRKTAVTGLAMIIKGRLERAHGVTNLVATDLGHLSRIYPEAAAALAERHRSRDFR
jgi:error-prone DNA polymerase